MYESFDYQICVSLFDYHIKVCCLPLLFLYGFAYIHTINLIEQYILSQFTSFFSTVYITVKTYKNKFKIIRRIVNGKPQYCTFKTYTLHQIEAEVVCLIFVATYQTEVKTLLKQLEHFNHQILVYYKQSTM